VGREIVHDDDVAGSQCRHEAALDISQKDIAVGWRIDHKGRRDTSCSEPGDEGCRLPMTVRNGSEESLSDGTPAV